MDQYFEIAADAGWCWFQNPRALMVGETLLAGYVCSGFKDPRIAGEIRVAEHDLSTGHTIEHVICGPPDESSRKVWVNDHNAPSLAHLPNGKVLSAASLHGVDNTIHFAEITLGGHGKPVERWSWRLPEGSKVTYSHLAYLESEGKLYNFIRGLHGSWKPSVMVSDDLGRSWHSYSILVDVKGEERKQRPYMIVASNGIDTIHFAFTDDHPRTFDNSLYHMVYRSGRGLMDSSGNRLGDLTRGIEHPSMATRIHRGSEREVAWPIQLTLDFADEPLILFQLADHSHWSKGEAQTPIEYWLAARERDGWSTSFVAEAGSQLYAGEDDYSGLAAITSGKPLAVVISTNRHPVSHDDLPKWGLWARNLSDSNSNWKPMEYSRHGDQHRPLIVGNAARTIVLWLEGEYTSYQDFQYRLRAAHSRRQRRNRSYE